MDELPKAHVALVVNDGGSAAQENVIRTEICNVNWLAALGSSRGGAVVVVVAHVDHFASVVKTLAKQHASGIYV